MSCSEHGGLLHRPPDTTRTGRILVIRSLWTSGTMLLEMGARTVIRPYPRGARSTLRNGGEPSRPPPRSRLRVGEGPRGGRLSRRKTLPRPTGRAAAASPEGPAPTRGTSAKP